MTKNLYYSPIDKNDILEISSDSKTHTGPDKFAIDFLVPESTDIRSAATGKVIFTKDDSSKGGDDNKYQDFIYYNHIIIKHKNGEYTEYGHLKNKGILKKVGDEVAVGEIIAVSGNTGYSAEPHLHFSVFVLDKMKPNFMALPKGKKYFINDEDFGFRTLEPNFSNIKIEK